LFELQSTNPNKFFPIGQIYQKAGINPKQTPTSGLWVWDDEHGCGVIQKEHGKLDKGGVADIIFSQVG
jgi:hypothetical protein